MSSNSCIRKSISLMAIYRSYNVKVEDVDFLALTDHIQENFHGGTVSALASCVVDYLGLHYEIQKTSSGITYYIKDSIVEKIVKVLLDIGVDNIREFSEPFVPRGLTCQLMM